MGTEQVWKETIHQSIDPLKVNKRSAVFIDQTTGAAIGCNKSLAALKSSKPLFAVHRPQLINTRREALTQHLATHSPVRIGRHTRQAHRPPAPSPIYSL